jgi:hypothetical protein
MTEASGAWARLYAYYLLRKRLYLFKCWHVTKLSQCIGHAKVDMLRMAQGTTAVDLWLIYV